MPRTDREIRTEIWTGHAEQLLARRGAEENPRPLAECLGEWLSAAEACGQGRRSDQLKFQVEFAVEKLTDLQTEIEKSTSATDRERALAFLRGETPEWR